MFSPSHFSRQFLTFRQQYIQGNKVDSALAEDLVDQLATFNLASLTHDGLKKATWLNLYNGLTSYWVITLGIQESPKELPGFYSAHQVDIGGLFFSLDDIEHGLLRKNARQHLSPDDPRLAHQVNTLDYRIHFALNCGARSCPPVHLFSADTIEDDLAAAETAFTATEFTVNHTQRTITCNMIFQWYRQDMPGRYLNQPELQGYETHLIDYDWRL